MPTTARFTRPVRVVTADDQAPFRETAHAVIVSTPGFEHVGESVDGESALRLVPGTDPDMVILDVRMPGLDGIEVARRLSAQDPSRLIVLASASPPRELAALARDSGVAAVVHKHWLSPRLLRGLWVAHGRRRRRPDQTA